MLSQYTFPTRPVLSIEMWLQWWVSQCCTQLDTVSQKLGGLLWLSWQLNTTPPGFYLNILFYFVSSTVVVLYTKSTCYKCDLWINYITGKICIIFVNHLLLVLHRYILLLLRQIFISHHHSPCFSIIHILLSMLFFLLYFNIYIYYYYYLGLRTVYIGMWKPKQYHFHGI